MLNDKFYYNKHEDKVLLYCYKKDFFNYLCFSIN